MISTKTADDVALALIKQVGFKTATAILTEICKIHGNTSFRDSMALVKRRIAYFEENEVVDRLNYYSGAE